MIIKRDNLPEQLSQDSLQVEAQRESVRSNMNFALSVLYKEHSDAWASALHAANSVIAPTLLELDLDASQPQHIGGDQAVSEARRIVREVQDELPA
jgi:hypothetical protein